MSESPSNPPSEDILRTGVYQPRRGPLAKTIAVLILLFLVLIPCLIMLLTITKQPPPPSDTGGPVPNATDAAPNR